MPSFLDNENQMLVDATLTEIGEHLVEDWINSNLDEGEFYSDQQIALMSGDNYLKDKFNKFYNLTPTDEGYLEC